MFRKLIRHLEEDRVGAILLKIVIIILKITRLDKVIILCSLRSGFKYSQYEFTPAEKAAGIRLSLKGYKNKPHRSIISKNKGMTEIRIDDCTLYFAENTFKPKELSDLYNEVFVPHEENPHAYETDYLKIGQGDYVVDAGACEGLFTIYALRRGARIVFAFEPLRRLSRGLNMTFKEEIKANRVQIFSKGLYDTQAVVKFDRGNDNVCCTAKINPSGSEECELSSLDGLVEAGEIPRVDFIKMDIEGAEVLAIKGAQNTIRKYKPRLSLAVYHEYENASTIRDLVLSYRPDYKVSFGGCWVWGKPFRPYMLYAW